MKKKKRDFYAANGFHVHKMNDLGRRRGYSESRMETAMDLYYDKIRPEYKVMGRLEREKRIDIARDVLRIARDLKASEFEDLGSQNERLKKENVEYRERWIFGTILLLLSWGLIIWMKIMGVQALWLK